MKSRSTEQLLRLLAQEQSDEEIGAALFISHRTVIGHVSNLFARLGVPSLTTAAHVVARRRLLSVVDTFFRSIDGGWLRGCACLLAGSPSGDQCHSPASRPRR